MASKKYVFVWNDGGIEVRPSWAYSEDVVWNWAIANLRPASMRDDAEAETFIRANGRVVEMEDEK